MPGVVGAPVSHGARRGTDEIVARSDGIRVTSPPRTVVDHTRYVDVPSLISMIEHALSIGYCTEATLCRTAERINTPGRGWVRRFLRVLASRRPGAPAESEGELRVFRALTRDGASGLLRQHPITLPGYGPARFDMAIPPINCRRSTVDLHPEHRTPDGIARDNSRDAAATSIGWVVRRIGGVELDRGHFDHTMRTLLSEVGVRRREVEALIRAGAWRRDER